jgi:uncharacterized Zn finger protein
MNDIEKEKKELPCPKCKRPIKTTLHDISSKKEVKCTSCGSMYKFDSSAASNLKSSIANMENAQKKFADAFHKLLTTATVLINNPSRK